MKKKILIFLPLFFIIEIISAQIEIQGTVKDNSSLPLPGANILEKGTTNGTATDFDGNFSLTVQEGATLIVSFTGYETQEIPIGDKTSFSIILNEGASLQEIVITGSRTPPRSNTTSPLPVDIVSAKELQSTGQQTFDKALQYKIPSFNTVQTPVNDATSLLDPYEIRNMGPSRTLVLINGKRKNLSSLLYTQTSPGQGETGADISAIPTDAIKTVQILRDGASAQYGSDAIAGVMNIILKDDYKNSSATLRTGITSEGDGESIGVSINNGSEIGEMDGFVNFTVDLSKTTLANRPGTVSALGEADGTTGFGADLDIVEEFLSRNPDAGNINGSPETTAAKFLVNSEVQTSEDKNLYLNAAYVYKKVNSFANYRTPYWRTLDEFPYLADLFPGSNPNFENGYDGYLPTFEGDMSDYNATLGFKSIINDWNTDLSVTVGGNKQLYTVNNTHNRTVFEDGSSLYGESTPISFQPGGTGFNHVVGNIDISRVLSDQLSFAVGSEFRAEFFDVIEGGEASYAGVGADSFAGNLPENSGKFSRYNIGGYLSASFDATEDLLFEGTVRGEDYSDFGTAFVWKLSSRYKFSDDKYTIRASASTGFRAPTLHQIYTQKSQYSFSEGQIRVEGIINNVSPTARRLGVPSLKAEDSFNFTVGIGAKPISNLSLTLDYYNIQVDDRIVYTKSLETDEGDVRYFVNGIDTQTSGLDFVIGYNRIALGQGKLGLNLSGNYVIENGRTDNNGDEFIDETQEALLFTSRPDTKWILGATYDIKKFGFVLNNTYFGKTTFHQADLNENLRTEFIPKVVTDLAVNFNFDEHWTIAANINNIFNILPEWEFKADNADGQAIIDDQTITDSGLTQLQNESNAITFNQRYSQMTYDGYHFSQLGTLFNLSVNYRF